MGNSLKSPESVTLAIVDRFCQTPGAIVADLSQWIEEALWEREDDRQQAYRAIQEAGRIIWDLLGEAPGPGGLPMARHDEIQAWLEYWTPEVFHPFPLILQAPEEAFPEDGRRLP